jgi:hypothetical protein
VVFGDLTRLGQCKLLASRRSFSVTELSVLAI